ncbi:MAG: hypothetical protein E7613_09410 [Ruminococcaceae bacterium]|nr:hypothetical protein [Oscillospiraceae bacterium]
MKSIIEEIWDNYQVEISETLTKETRAKHIEMTEKHDELIRALDEHQKELLTSYLDAQNTFQSASDKSCFADGVRFGIQLILDATTDNR